MRRFKAVGLMVVAIFALALAMTASASAAEPEATLLAKETFPVTFEGTSGKGKLENTAGDEIACEKGKNSGTLSNSKEGIVTFTFEGCITSLFKITCNTEGSAAGVIRTEGPFKLVYDSLKPLLVALRVSYPLLHIQCGGFGLLQLKATALILLKFIDVETKSLEFVLEEAGGKPEDKTYWEGGVEQHPLLLMSKNEGMFIEAGAESTATKATTSKSLTIVG